jgi:hypothetical protein
LVEGETHFAEIVTIHTHFRFLDNARNKGATGLDDKDLPHGRLSELRQPSAVAEATTASDVAVYSGAPVS